MLQFNEDFYKRLFHALDNNSVLMRVDADGTYYPVWCSDEFCQMMEGTQDDFIRLENASAMNTIHPDDHEAVAFLFKHHHAPDGSNSLTIRKTTIKGNELHVCVHYAFIEEDGVQYAYCSYFDVTEMKQNQRQTEDAYEGMLNQFNAMADESLTVFRTNLTKGVIEDVRGYDLYPTDFVGGSIAESAKIRAASFLVPGDNEKYNEIFALDKLLKRYYNGEGPATFVGYCRRHSDRQCFVKFSGTARKNPVTGDVTAFGIETEYNNQHISEVLNNKVLAKQYDMVCYIVGDTYGVVIGNAANIKRGNIFPKEKTGSYSGYIETQVFPAIAGSDGEKAAVRDALSTERIRAELSENESYAVDVAVELSGETFNKHFMFYPVDREANFYILLKSDMTEALREQRERERSLSLHNSMMEQFNAIAEESLTVVRSNVTTGKIMDIRGTDLYPSDKVGCTIGEYAEARLASFVSQADRERYIKTFDMEHLLSRTERGLGAISMTACCLRADGTKRFVKFTGSASRNPVTGEADAFGIETDCNSEVVSEILDNKVLARQYDMVCYIAGDTYGVVIGDAANIQRGSIFPKEKTGSYADYIRNQVIPVADTQTHDRLELLESLSASRIEEELSKGEPYAVDVTCRIDGDLYTKRFVFYMVDRAAKFYILLKSDVTEILNERESNAILHKTLGSGPWSMDFDEAGTMTSVTWTEPFRKMLGYESEEDFPNRLESWSDLLHKDDKERVLSEFNSTIADYTGKKSYDVEYRLLTKDRGWRWFHAMGRLRRRADGTPVTYVGMFVDITEKKEMEAQIQEQQRLLETALEEAKRVNVAKTTFLSNMSHDIRTPMNAIIGFTNLALQTHGDAEKVTEYLGKIKTSSDHLLSLINDVLEMSRIESGKIELDEQPCSLPEILHSLNTIITGQVEGKQQTLNMDTLNVHDEDIYCDKLRLNQVLLNLLSNAVKYTPNGGAVSVRVEQREGAPTGYGSYRIQVKDNGIGMSPEFAARVFEAFERERNSTVSGIQGTGLGMAITKKIVDMMGGEISVETEQGKGTTFTVDVRFRIAEGAAKKDHRIVELDGIHALVVDDDFNTCDSTMKMLAKMGMRPEWTLSGKEAVLHARQAKEMGDGYGVFIIDLKLPDMNGVEVTRQIRAAIGADTPILLMTAYDWPAIKDEAQSAGINAFCNKPVFLSELHSALSRAIGSVADDGADGEEQKQADFSGMRLLLVDDMDVNREIAVMLLEMHGFAVEQAANGKEAVEKVERAEAGYYDAVLMDIQMPVMNGYEATREIRALGGEKAKVPIVAMTANAFDEDRRAALEAGMNAHIAKPIDEEQLFGVLAELAGK